ncbi:Uncharacterised protein [Enterobacter cloacae]|nr:Uncharacterised protein [Enterobacter cloacae]
MNAGQYRRLPRNVTVYQGDVILSGCQFFKTHHQEIAPWGWQFGFCHTFKLHVILHTRLTRFVPLPHFAFCIGLFCHKPGYFT